MFTHFFSGNAHWGWHPGVACTHQVAGSPFKLPGFQTAELPGATAAGILPGTCSSTGINFTALCLEGGAHAMESSSDHVVPMSISVE